MSRPVCIGVFYSKGRSYLEVLRCVHRHEPEARVCAIVPRGYLISPEERAASDEIVETERTGYSLQDLGALRSLLRQIRGARYDTFVILFDSPRLRILAALSGARQCAHCTFDGRLARIGPSVAGTLCDVAARNVWGRLVYALVWLVVWCLRVPARTTRTRRL